MYSKFLNDYFFFHFTQNDPIKVSRNPLINFFIKICSPVLISGTKFSLEKRLELIEIFWKSLVNNDGEFKEFFGLEIIDVFHKIIDQVSI